MLVKPLHRLNHLIDISRGIAEASHVLILTDTIRIEQAGPDTLTDLGVERGWLSICSMTSQQCPEKGDNYRGVSREAGARVSEEQG